MRQILALLVLIGSGCSVRGPAGYDHNVISPANSSLDFGQAWLFGGAVAVLAPAGQLLASALLPASASPASALRRLDSLLLTAPLWAWGVGLVL